MMEPFRITEISAQGVTMNRLPVTPAEEAQVRNALAQAKDMLTADKIKENLNEQEEYKPVYPSGYRINCAPWHRIPGGQDTVQPGIQVEPEPIRCMGNQGERQSAGGGKTAGR